MAILKGFWEILQCSQFGGSIHPGRFPQGPINHALPATWAPVERLNNALGEISQQQETCGWIIFWVSFEI
jgi:hypothetical protein